jgi:hypothetical protein
MFNRAALLGFGLTLVFAGGALAQAPDPFGPPPPGFGPGGGATRAAPPAMQATPAGPPGQPPCMAEFAPLRSEAEKRAGLIKAAADRKADRSEICTLITRFSEAEAKFVKYVEANHTWCGIPPNVVAQIKTNHGKTVATRKKVCSTAPMGVQGPALPPGPGLSDALGLTRAPSAANTSTGKGTYDTLTGNPIK